jgi:minor histocompatibility antigen H13
MPLQFLLEHADLVVSEIKLLAITLTILYVTAHASLRRPPSAAPAQEPKRVASAVNPDDSSGLDDEDEDEEEEEDEYERDTKQPLVQRLELSDAILFPVMASTVLVGLYYLIQYLQEPDILNTILQWYISLASLAGLNSLYRDGLNLAMSAVFPRYWRSGAKVYRVCQSTRRHLEWKSTADSKAPVAAATFWGPLPTTTSSVRLPAGAQRLLWSCRGLLTQRWRFELSVRGLGEAKTSIRLHNFIAMVLAGVTVASYHAWMTTSLSNLIGLSLCYVSPQMISPTTFPIAYAILGGLFFYDIAMVFYT